MNIKIIGLGGIGSVLCESISRYLNFHEDSHTIYLVDGDSYENKNRERQVFSMSGGNKADTKIKELADRFPNITFEAIPVYVSESNIDEIINEDDMIFCCVDNHPTRKIISEKVQSLINCTLISGGNDLVDGNVQLFHMRGGEKVTPSLTDYHPEIMNPVGKHPDEMSCEELAVSEPQLFFTNMTVAVIMCWIFENIMVGAADIADMKSEVYFDTRQLALNAVSRAPRS